MEVATDTNGLRDRARELEAEVEKLKAATARCNSESAHVGAELATVRSLLEEARRKAAQQHSAEDAVVRGQSGTSAGSTGGSSLVEGERSMKVCALEAQLVTTKVGLAQARFERDSLQSDVRQLRRSLAASASYVGHLPLEEEHHAWSTEGAADELASEVAMRVGSVYQSGTLYAHPGRLKFFPAYRRALRRKDKELEVMLTEKDNCFIQRVEEANGAIAQLLGTIDVGQSVDDGIHRLMGFRSSMEFIHSHLKARALAVRRQAQAKQAAKPPSSAAAAAKTAVAGTSPAPPVHEQSPPQRRNGKDEERRADPADRPAVVEKLQQWDGSPVAAADSPSTALPDTNEPSGTPPGRRPQLDFTQELSNPSEILEPAQCAELALAIPARFRTSHWQLLYSTSLHGYSLHTFYTKVAKRSPTLLCVRDSQDNTFGCYTSAPWKHSLAYFGTGETFLFTAHPNFEVYRWTHANSFFQLGGHDSLAVGGGGHFGLWLDSEFHIGTSGRSETFDNEPLSGQGDFKCIVFEAWTFVPRSQLRDVTQK